MPGEGVGLVGICPFVPQLDFKDSILSNFEQPLLLLLSSAVVLDHFDQLFMPGYPSGFYFGGVGESEGVGIFPKRSGLAHT